MDKLISNTLSTLLQPTTPAPESTGESKPKREHRRRRKEGADSPQSSPKSATASPRPVKPSIAGAKLAAETGRVAWKSPVIADPTAPQPPSVDPSAVQASLDEVKRMLKALEESTTAERRHAEKRHEQVIRDLKSKPPSEPTGASPATLLKALDDSAAMAVVAQAQAKETSARIEAEARCRELEHNLQREEREHQASLQQLKEDLDRRLAAVRRESEVAVHTAQAEAQIAINRAESSAASASAMKMEADMAKMDAAATRARGEAAIAAAAAAAAAEVNASMRPELEAARVTAKEAQAAMQAMAADLSDFERRSADLKARERAFEEHESSERRALKNERMAVRAEREAGRSELEQWKSLARTELAAERESLLRELEERKTAAAAQAAIVGLGAEIAILFEEQQELARSRLQLDADAAAITREAAAARLELANCEAATQATYKALAAAWSELEAERLEVHALMERDRSAYADALQAERIAAAAAAASVSGSYVQQIEKLHELLAVAEAARQEGLHAAQREREEGRSEVERARLSVAEATRATAEAEAAATKAQVGMAAASESEALTRTYLQDARLANAELSSKLHQLESKLEVSERASEQRLAEAIAESVAEAAAAAKKLALNETRVEQAEYIARAAKALADEHIETVQAEAQWQNESLKRQLAEARGALELASAQYLSEQSAVFSLRAMLLVADADVAAMRGAAAHYAALGGEEAGALREALSHAEVSKREAIEAERRRSDAWMEKEREHFGATLHHVREASFAATAKLSSQLDWISDALEDKSRKLLAEREAFESALAKEREATNAARDASRRVLQEVADRQAARHALELTQQGQTMEAQLSVEREAFLEQLVDRKDLQNSLADARAECRAAKLALVDAQQAHQVESARLLAQLAEAREGGSSGGVATAAQKHAAAAHEEALRSLTEQHQAATRALQESFVRERQMYERRVAQLTAEIERERASKGTERRIEHRIEPASPERRPASDAQQQASPRAATSPTRPTKGEQGKFGHAAHAQGKGDAQHDAQQQTSPQGKPTTTDWGVQTSLAEGYRDAQLQETRTLGEMQLARLHADQREAMQLEAEGARRRAEALASQLEAMRRELDATQKERDAYSSQLETIQKEIDAYSDKGDADARVQLPLLLAELAATRRLLQQVSNSPSRGAAVFTAEGVLRPGDLLRDEHGLVAKPPKQTGGAGGAGGRDRAYNPFDLESLFSR